MKDTEFVATYQIAKTGVTLQGFSLTGGRGTLAGVTIAGQTVTIPDRHVNKVEEAFVRTGWLRRVS